MINPFVRSNLGSHLFKVHGWCPVVISFGKAESLTIWNHQRGTKYHCHVWRFDKEGTQISNDRENSDGIIHEHIMKTWQSKGQTNETTIG